MKFLRNISEEQRTLEVVELAGEVHDALVFHDADHLASFPAIGTMKFEALLDHQAAPARWILHHGFACSTLLARCLDARQTAFVYREPAAITELALMPRRDPKLVRALAAWHRRGERPEQIGVVKACDLVTGIADELLSLDPGARAIVLHTDLETFVVNCSKDQGRLDWTRSRVELARQGARGDELADGAAAAVLWSAHMDQFAALSARFGDRVLALDASAMIEEPLGATCEVAAFFGLDVHAVRPHAARVLARKTHAKTGAPWDEDTWRVELEHARMRAAGQLERAERWCLANAGVLRFA